MQQHCGPVEENTLEQGINPTCDAYTESSCAAGSASRKLARSIVAGRRRQTRCCCCHSASCPAALYPCRAHASWEAGWGATAVAASCLTAATAVDTSQFAPASRQFAPASRCCRHFCSCRCLCSCSRCLMCVTTQASLRGCLPASRCTSRPLSPTSALVGKSRARVRQLPAHLFVDAARHYVTCMRNVMHQQGNHACVTRQKYGARISAVFCGNCSVHMLGARSSMLVMVHTSCCRPCWRVQVASRGAPSRQALSLQ